MKNSKGCNHFTKFKKESFNNVLQKRTTELDRCDNTKNSQCESDVDRYMCCECAFVGCSRNSNNKCSTKHSANSGHKVVISLAGNMMIWCYECDDDFDSILDEYSEDDRKPSQIKKMEEFQDSIRQILFKYQKTQKQNKANIPVEQKNEQSKQQSAVKPIKELSYVPVKVFGLKNLGNTCFFNSVMQCLNGATFLVNYYMDSGKTDFTSREAISIQLNDGNANEDDEWQTEESVVEKRKKGQKNKQIRPDSATSSYQNSNMINAKFQQFLICSRKVKGFYDPTDLFKAVSVIHNRFRSMAQQDAQELLRCLLDGLSTGEEKILKAKGRLHKTEGKAKSTQVEQIFGSYLCNYRIKILLKLVECLDCGHISRTFDFCLDLVVQIALPKGRNNLKQARLANKPQPLIVQPKQQVLKAQSDQNPASSSQRGKKSKKNKSNQKNSDNIDQESIQQEIIEEQDQINHKTEEMQPPSEIQEQDEEPQVEETDTFEYQNCKYKLIPRAEIDNEKIPYFDHDSNDLYQAIEYTQEKSKNQLSVRNCLDAFTEFEALNMKDNHFRCERCWKNKKISTKALRRFYLYDTPPVLTIVLKRFSQKSSGRFEKIIDPVELEEYIDIGKYVLPKAKSKDLPEDIINETLCKQKYKLFGVVVHGGSLSGGHYVAYVRHVEQNEDHWFYYSDTNFREVSLKQVLASQAYILFYEKCI